MRFPLPSLIVLTALAFTACSDLGAHLRRHTYPPDFNYIEERKLDSAMWRMAFQVRRLDQTLRDPDLAEPQRQRAVLDALDRIDAAAARLDGDRRASNHPVLDRHLPQLRDDISLARNAAAATPPRYALAGAVAGACVYCHVPRVATQGTTSSSDHLPSGANAPGPGPSL